MRSGEPVSSVVAYARDLKSIGIDMESAEPMESKLIEMICLPGENPDKDGALAKCLFSIKESIYKCLFPLTGGYIDFLEMEVTLNADSSFKARSLTGLCPPELAARLEGSVDISDCLIMSAAWVSAD